MIRKSRASHITTTRVTKPAVASATRRVGDQAIRRGRITRSLVRSAVDPPVRQVFRPHRLPCPPACSRSVGRTSDSAPDEFSQRARIGRQGPGVAGIGLMLAQQVRAALRLLYVGSRRTPGQAPRRRSTACRPCGGLGNNNNVPPCLRATRSTMARPSPLPPLRSLRTNGRTTRSACSGVRPMP